MNTQTFAHAQAFTAINDDELMAVNGGGAGATLGWNLFNGAALGIPKFIDSMQGNKVTQAIADY